MACSVGRSTARARRSARPPADEFLDWGLAKLGVKLETTSASAKGEAIAEALMARRALLVLDGVEPLQHRPGPRAGQLKDQGLRTLFAASPPARRGGNTA